MVAADQAPFNIEAYLPVVATVYGEAAGQSKEAKIQVASSIFNRAESGKAEFGAHTGRITDVLDKGYYSYSKKSKKFMEAMSQNFPDKESVRAFNQAKLIVAGILNGDIKRTDTQFFFTKKELEKIKKNKLMNLDLLEETHKDENWVYMRYKPQQARKKKL